MGAIGAEKAARVVVNGRFALARLQIVHGDDRLHVRREAAALDAEGEHVGRRGGGHRHGHAALVQGTHEGQRAGAGLNLVGVEGAHALEDHLEHRLVALAETALLM